MENEKDVTRQRSSVLCSAGKLFMFVSVEVTDALLCCFGEDVAII